MRARDLAALVTPCKHFCSTPRQIPKNWYMRGCADRMQIGACFLGLSKLSVKESSKKFSKLALRSKKKLTPLKSRSRARKWASAIAARRPHAVHSLKGRKLFAIRHKQQNPAATSTKVCEWLTTESANRLARCTGSRRTPASLSHLSVPWAASAGAPPKHT